MSLSHRKSCKHASIKATVLYKCFQEHYTRDDKPREPVTACILMEDGLIMTATSGWLKWAQATACNCDAGPQRLLPLTGCQAGARPLLPAPSESPPQRTKIGQTCMTEQVLDQAVPAGHRSRRARCEGCLAGALSCGLKVRPSGPFLLAPTQVSWKRTL